MTTVITTVTPQTIVQTQVSKAVITAMGAEGKAQLRTLCALTLDPALLARDYASAVYAAAQHTSLFARPVKTWANYVSGARHAREWLVNRDKLSQTWTVASLADFLQGELDKAGYLPNPEDIGNFVQAKTSMKSRAKEAREAKEREAVAQALAQAEKERLAKEEEERLALHGQENAKALEAKLATAEKIAELAAIAAVPPTVTVGLVDPIQTQAQAQAMVQALAAEEDQPVPPTAQTVEYELISLSSQGKLYLNPATTDQDILGLIDALQSTLVHRLADAKAEELKRLTPKAHKGKTAKA